jgi:hypothetical protein
LFSAALFAFLPLRMLTQLTAFFAFIQERFQEISVTAAMAMTTV